MRISRVYFLVFILFLLAGCGGSGSTGTPEVQDPNPSSTVGATKHPSPTPEPSPTPDPPTPTPALADPPDDASEGGEEIPAGTGVIAGEIWHDVCATRLDSAGNVLEAGPGCIVVEGVYIGNGNQEQDNTGISGLTAALSAGGCGAETQAEAETDENGGFRFEGLAPGSYCVSVPAALGNNSQLLDDGVWTTGVSGFSGVEVELADGEILEDLSFGWDYEDLPVLEASACSEKVTFIADVTVPDHTHYDAGESFEKVWEIRNDGTCIWSPEYRLIFVSGEALGAVESTAFPEVTAPGETVRLSVEMQAPSAAGTHFGNWQFRDPAGNQFGVGVPATSFLWVIIEVGYINEDGSSADPPGTGGGDGSGEVGPSCTIIVSSGVESEIIVMINAIRGESGLPPLATTSALTVAARGHSQDMATHDFVSHTGSDGSLWYGRISAQGYTYSYALENIYVGNPAFGGTAAGAVDWWMNSQVHRDNILSQAVTAIGVGYVFCDTSTYGGYYTAVFAKP